MNHSTMFSLLGYQAANKKQLKDTTPWHQHHHSQPLQPNPNRPLWSEDDGGWSKGTPGGGTSWGGSSRTAVPSSSEPHTTRGGVSRDCRVENSSDGIASGRWGGKPSADLDRWSPTVPEQGSIPDTPDTWNSDNDNSPGGGVGDCSWQVGSKWNTSDAEVFDKEESAMDGCSQDCAGREELVSQGRSTGSDVDDLDSFSLSSSDRDTQVFGNTGDSGGGVVIGNGVNGAHQEAGLRDAVAGEVGLSGSMQQGHPTSIPATPSSQPGTPTGKQHKADVVQDVSMRSGRADATTNRRPDVGNGQQSDLANRRSEGNNGRSEGSNGRSEGNNGRSEGSNGRSEGSNGRSEGSNGRSEGSNGRSEGNNGRSEGNNEPSASAGSNVGTQGGWKSDGRGRGPKGGGGGTRGRVDSNHGSQVGGGSGGSGKTRKKQKPAVDLGDALGALQSEPSGWGELPSPKPNENDTGTECWGVPPDMKERLERGGGQKTPSDGSSGWGDQAGTGAAQWSNGCVNRNKDRSESFNITEAVRSLMDMGFPAQESEKALKMNNNNLEATIGDLLALQALQEEEGQQQAFIIPSALSTKNKKPVLASRPPQTAPSLAVHNMTTHSLVSMVTAPTPSSNSPTPNTIPAFQQQHLHTLQSLLALQSPMLPQQTLPNPLLQPPITPQQQAVQSQVLQTLLQQQRLLGLLPPPNFQQVLTQQLGQAQLTKQQLMVQLKAPNQQSQGAQQQLQLQLARCNQYINLINQQLVMLSVQQQKEKAQPEGKGGGGGASPLIGRSNSLPANSKADQKFVLSNGAVLRPPFAGTTGGTPSMDVKTLPYILQDLALGSALTNATPTINPPTSRSTSRLQQLIPGESVSIATKEDQGGAVAFPVSAVPPPPSPVPPPQATIAPPQNTTTAPPQTILPFQTSAVLAYSSQGQMSLPLLLPSQPSSSFHAPVSTTTPTSAPVPSSTNIPTTYTPTSLPTAPPTTYAAPPTTSAATPTSGPPHPALLADIPEFRPGVLWQPRAQATEPAQLYAIKPSHSLPSTPLSLPEGSELKASAFADAVQSTILGGGAVGGVNRYGVGVPFPSMTTPNGTSSQTLYRQPHPASVQPIGSQVGMAKPARAARGYPPSGLGQQQQQQQQQQHQQQQYLGRPGGISMGTSNSVGSMGGGNGGGVNRASIRRSLSTSGLISSSSQAPQALPFNSGLTSSQVQQQQQAYMTAKKRGSLPQSSPAGFEPSIVQSQYGITQHQQQNLGLSDARRWGGGSPDALQAGKGWVPEAVSKSRWGKEAGWKNTFGPPSSFEDPLHQPSAPLDQYPVTNTTLGSLAVGGRTWTQDGIRMPFNGPPLSPEPTYAEWQAGKKARFPLFKSGSGGNPNPSLWLVVKNITPQVDEMSLREVCREYGMVQSCITSPNMDLAFVKYASQTDSMKARIGLEGNPNICGVMVSVDFISEAEVAGLLESFSQLRQDSDGGDFGSLGDRGGSLPIWLDDGFDNDAHFAGEQFDNGKWNAAPAPSRNSKFGPRSSSSLWNDGNFLSGLSNAWQQSSHVPRQDHEDASTLLGGNPSNYLPNGLL